MNALKLYILRHVPTLAIIDMGWDKEELTKRMVNLTLQIEQIDNYLITTHMIEYPGGGEHEKESHAQADSGA